MKSYDLIIGVDTGTKTGFAVWNKPLKKLSLVDAMPIFEALEWTLRLNKLHDGSILVRVEDARKRTWIPKEQSIQQRVGRAKGAGSVCRDASIWEEFLTAKQIPFELVAPKSNKTKLDDKTFKKITGWQEKTNEHGRDAAMLVVGK